MLVTDAIEKICRSMESIKNDKKFKLILMSITGNSNRDLAEKPPLSQRWVISILKLLLPAHVDNEKAADFLRLQIGQNHESIEWAVVRPDSLIDDEEVTNYKLLASPIRSVRFDAGSTGRINVANVMSRLITEEVLWNQWKGKMPVIYNQPCKNQIAVAD